MANYRTALKPYVVLILLEVCSHLLVYWPAEGNVTAISVNAVNGLSTTFMVGEECEVTVNKKVYNGKVAAKGTNITHIILYK